MNVYDTVNKQNCEADEKQLIELMLNGRQVDIIWSSPKTDDDGYLTWDTEHWSTIDGKRFIRCYSYKGRVLNDYTAHNIYDLRNDFVLKEAKIVQLS